MLWKLVHQDPSLGEAWRKHFTDEPSVEILDGDICTIGCDAVVSPANSFGFMDGGLDYALSERFGWDLQDRLQERIRKRPARELLVGEALVVPTGDAKTPWLISAPTMRVPMRLRQTVNAFLAMKTILATARDFDGNPPIRSVAIPGLGTGVGSLPADVAALQMWKAFEEVVLGRVPPPEDFGEAQLRHRQLNPEINIWDAD